MHTQSPENFQAPQILGSVERRLFQIAEALSLEERNLRNNPSGLSRAADFIEEFCGLREAHWILGAHYDSAPGPLFTVKDRHKNCLRMNCGLTWTNAIETALKTLGTPRAQTTLIPLPRLSINLRPQS